MIRRAENGLVRQTRGRRVLAVLGLVAALTGLWMAHCYPGPEGDGEALYLLRLVFGAAMAVSIVLVIQASRRRNLVSHGTWRTCPYAIGIGAAAQVGAARRLAP